MSNKKGAIVTGAASGVGLQLSKMLVSKGWHVVMTDINPAGKSVSAALGNNVLWVESNIADWDSQVTMFEKAFEWFPHITFLAANAGISTNMTAPTGIMSTEEGGFPRKPPLQVLDVNLMGTIFSIKLFLHHVHKHNPVLPKDGSPKARIIITGSEGGLYALPADPVYCASKHGLVGLTRSLGPAYLGTYGISINSINPGYMKTPLVAPLIPITPDKYETPLSTIMRAFEELIESYKTGQIVEASGKNFYYQPQQAYPDDVAKWVWEDAPAFWMHAITKMGASS